MKTKFDWITVLLIVALLVTLIVFHAGALPYPYPYVWVVISMLLVFRLTAHPKKT